MNTAFCGFSEDFKVIYAQHLGQTLPSEASTLFKVQLSLKNEWFAHPRVLRNNFCIGIWISKGHFQ